MKLVLRQLALGFLLIAAVSTLLLFSDLDSRIKPATPGETARPARLPRVAIVQHNTQPVFDAGVQGMIDGLAESGFRDGSTVQLRRFNPLGDTNLANAIAREVAEGGYDLILTATTPSAQTVGNANRARHTPHVFALVADPTVIGLGITALDSPAHPAHLTGYGTRLPVANAFRLARQLNPALKTVGTLWNTAEVNSEVQLQDARKVCAELGLTLIEVNVDGTGAVAEATAAVCSRGIEALFIPGDITVLSAVNNVIQIAQRAGLPAFSLFPSAIPKGELFNVGADYHAVGHRTGLLAGDILHGRSPATVPVTNFVPEKLALNAQVLATLRNKSAWSFPAEIRDKAVIFVDADGRITDRSAATAGREPARATPAAPLPPKTIALAYFAPEPSWQDCRNGLLDELRTLGYEEGKNLTVRSAHTQGEASNITAILQNYEASDADALVTFSTPLLQGMLATIKHKPVVFTYVTDPIAAGAGKSWTEHDPRLTGVGTMVPVAEGVRVLRALFPHLKRLGTLYNAGEVNSTRVIDLLGPACAAAGIELEKISIAATSEAVQAAQALVARRVEAVYLPNDNLVYQAFPGIAQTLARARLPIMNGDPAYLGRGVLASVGPGYYAAGQAAARKLVRVLAGEKPVSIPMENVSTNRIGFDRAVAAKLGLTFDEALLKSLETPPRAPSAPAGRTPAPATLAFAFLAPEPGVESCMQGVLDGLRKLGYDEGRNLQVRRAHASGEVVNIPSLLQNFDSSNASLIVTFTTAVSQAAVSQVKQKPVVFTYVTDPIAAQLGRSWTDHPAHLTGIGSFPPVQATLDLIRRVQPGLKRLGTLYNSGESNSTSIVAALRPLCTAAGIELIELPAVSTNEVLPAFQGLVARGVEAVYLPSDNTANLAFSALAAGSLKARIPLYIDDATFLDQGAFAAIGPSYYHSGLAAAPRIARILAGESPAAIPLADHSVPVVKFNRDIAARLGLVLDETLLKSLETAPPSAAVPAARETARPPSAPPAAPARPRNVEVIYYNETAPSEDTLAGLKEGLAKGPLLEGRDFTLRYRNAQGDMSVLSSLYDAALTARADLIVPLSTPSLQVGLGKVRNTQIPLVFAMVANPIAAGAGKTYEDHLPRVTGVSVRAPAPQMIELLTTHFPQFKRIGTLFCPSEVNSVDLKNYLTEVAAAHGITVEAVAANSPTELVDAAQSLVSRRIDAVVQISDNLTSAGFTAIARAARAARKPLISMNSTTIPQGSGLSMGHDYHDVGLTAADYVQRVLQGENPAGLPFIQPRHIRLTAHLANAQATGLEIPESLLSRCDPVIRN